MPPQCHHHCNLFLCVAGPLPFRARAHLRRLLLFPRSTAASSSLRQSQSHNSQPKTAMSSLSTAPMPITSHLCSAVQPRQSRADPSCCVLSPLR
ncbi:hypothetical protein M0R45_028478 [Rubus argutus]|uniref:Uncharacterized protein n=1 Tax=Rubus argutus TaxID=59490 RepID=A0AAW1W8V4_RUBAR